jgi:hypothetical protein
LDIYFLMAASRTLKSAVPTTLNKPVAALAIVPLNKNLTVTARKAYNVMLHIAQRAGDTGDAGFSAPLNSILRGFGVDNNVSTDAKRYIVQMASTKIEWRPLSSSEGWQLPDQAGAQAVLPDFEPPEDELRIFHLLSEVRLYKKGTENWVTWFYPPTIKEQMLGPHRWARLQLEVISRLKTYTAVALYEICARYRDNPGGVTSRHPWAWWVQVLKGSEGGKQREWRKFKNEFVNPAIREINDESDLTIELLEFKKDRSIAEIQFSVVKKPAGAAPPEPADVTNLLHAARLGIRDADAEALLERFGEQAMAEGLVKLERQMHKPGAAPVVNKSVYLKSILLDMTRPANEAPPARAVSTAPAAAPGTIGGVADQRFVAALAVVRRAFESLSGAEQAEWIKRLHAHVQGQGGANPTILRRLTAGQWQSPLITAMSLRYFAEQTYGPDWIEQLSRLPAPAEASAIDART